VGGEVTPQRSVVPERDIVFRVEARNSPYDFATARKAIVAALGVERIVELHRQKPWIDWLTIVLHWALFLGLAWYLAYNKRDSVIWWVAFFLQGFVIMAFGYLMHDLSVHRRFGGKRFSYWLGFVSGALSLFRVTKYAHVHNDHHIYTGTDPDEAYKQDLDTRWKRFLFATPVGYFLAVFRFLNGKNDPEFPAPEAAFGPTPPKQRRILNRETVLFFLFYAGIAVAAVYFRPVRQGYLMPLAFALPVANLLRIVLEHSETNPRNIYHCATYYRTGLLTRPLFFWDAGDCHLVHHLFPTIPFYNMGRACDEMRPILIEQGVRERRWLPGLLWGYLVRNEPHRTLWAT
jgi:fatty acid desaturase